MSEYVPPCQLTTYAPASSGEHVPKRHRCDPVTPTNLHYTNLPGKGVLCAPRPDEGLVYGLVDRQHPRHIFYVGITSKHPAKRFSQHLGTWGYKSGVAREFFMVLLEDRVPIARLETRESRWILRLKRIGMAEGNRSASTRDAVARGKRTRHVNRACDLEFARLTVGMSENEVDEFQRADAWWDIWEKVQEEAGAAYDAAMATGAPTEPPFFYPVIPRSLFLPAPPSSPLRRRSGVV